MAAQSPPFALQASSHSAELFRRALASLITGAGVVSPTDLKVSQNTGTDLKVQVAAGQVWIAGTFGSSTGFGINRTPVNSTPGALVAAPNFTNQGMYYGFNDAAITGLSLAAANATNPRYDIFVATVLDAQYSGATNSFVIQVVTGTAAASPLFPTTPANSYMLGFAYIAANATAVTNADIGDRRSQAIAGLGGWNSQQATEAVVATQESTTSSSPTDLATFGPRASIYVPQSGSVLVTITSGMNNSVANAYCIMGFAMSGANTQTATSGRTTQISGPTTLNPMQSSTFLMQGLSAGLTNFDAKYWTAGGGTAFFSNRRVTLLALP